LDPQTQQLHLVSHANPFEPSNSPWADTRARYAGTRDVANLDSPHTLERPSLEFELRDTPFLGTSQPRLQNAYVDDVVRHAAAVSRHECRSHLPSADEHVAVNETLPPRPLAPWERRALGEGHDVSPFQHAQFGDVEPSARARRAAMFDILQREIADAVDSDARAYEPQQVLNATAERRALSEETSQWRDRDFVTRRHNDRRRWIDDPPSSRAPTVDELLDAVETRARYANA
jgi:hypothetical protein